MTSAKTIPITFLDEHGAVPIRDLPRILGTSRTRAWRLRNLPKNDPRKIRCTSYGTVPLAEIDRHMKAEMERA